MTAPRYTYRTVNIVTGIRSAELPLLACQFTRVRNSAGPWSAVLPLNSAVQALDPIRVTEPNASELVIERRPSSGGAAQVVYCGIIQDREYDSQSQALRISGREPWSYFDKRFIEDDVTYTATDQGLIAADMLNVAATKPVGDFRVDLPSTAQLTTGVARTLSYLMVDCKPIAEAIEEMASMLSGFEFSLDGYWSGNQLRHQFVIGYPALGARGGGLAQWDLPGAVQSYRWQEQGGAMANEVFGIGDDGSGHIQLQRVITTPGSQLLLQGQQSFRAVAQSAALLAWVQEWVTKVSVPSVVAYVTVAGAKSPELGSYGLGDDVMFQFNDFRFSNQPHLSRLLGWTVTCPQRGVPETVDLMVEGL